MLHTLILLLIPTYTTLTQTIILILLHSIQMQDLRITIIRWWITFKIRNTLLLQISICTLHIQSFGRMPDICLSNRSRNHYYDHAPQKYHWKSQTFKFNHKTKYRYVNALYFTSPTSKNALKRPVLILEQQILSSFVP